MTEILGLLGRLFGLLTIPLMMLTILGLNRQMRKEQPVSLSAPIIGLVMAPLALIINVVFLRQAFQSFLGSALLIFGIAFGLSWGQTARLYSRGGLVVARRSALHLVFWLLSYAITQVLATFAPAYVVAGGLAAMFFSTGATLGTNLNMLTRHARIRPSFKFATMPTFLPEAGEHRWEERGSGPPMTLPERTTEERDSILDDLPK